MNTEQQQQLDQVIKRHTQQPPSSATLSEWKDIDFLLSIAKGQEAHKHQCELVDKNNHECWAVFDCDEPACTGKRYCPPCLKSAVQISAEVMGDY